MDGNFDPMLCLAHGSLAAFAAILIATAILAAVGAAAGVPISELVSIAS
jgi:hypothetical protein